MRSIIAAELLHPAAQTKAPNLSRSRPTKVDISSLAQTFRGRTVAMTYVLCLSDQ